MKLLGVALVFILIAGDSVAREPPTAPVPPEQDYMLYCMGCHQRDGSGADTRVPPLLSMDRFMRVPRGRQYLVRVPGVAHSGLSDERLAALLNWTLKEFGSSEFTPYTPDEVAPLRADPFVNAAEAREALMLPFDRQTESNAAAKTPGP